MDVMTSPPTPKHTLLALKGRPCSGKGGIARAVADRLGWPVLDKDDILDAHRVSLDSDAFLQDRRRLGALAYDAVWRMASRQLALGICVIVDTPLACPKTFAEASRVAHGGGGRLVVASVELDDAVWFDRLDERAREDPHTHKLCGRAGGQRWRREHPYDYEIPQEIVNVAIRTASHEIMMEDVENLLLPALASP